MAVSSAPVSFLSFSVSYTKQSSFISLCLCRSRFIWINPSSPHAISCEQCLVPTTTFVGGRRRRQRTHHTCFDGWRDHRKRDLCLLVELKTHVRHRHERHTRKKAK
ncbi:unnamed protein product [Musa acuminata subsp. burmannicoides]